MELPFNMETKPLRHHKLPNKIPVTGVRYHFLSYGTVGSHRPLEKLQAIVFVLGCPTKLDVNTILLKTAHT